MFKSRVAVGITAAFLGLVILVGLAVAAPSVIRVRYYGADTTFEALFAEGKEVHCVTEQTADLARRGVFEPAIDTVLCFDTMAEADREFARMGGLEGRTVEAQRTPIKVRYYDMDTTFEALFAEGKEVHCVTEQTADLARRGVFEPTRDRVLCFDTIAEADREFARMHPSFQRRDHSSSMRSAAKLASPRVYQSCADWFALYRQTGYVNWWYDLCSDNPNVTEPIWSVWENGIAAMRVYKNTGYSGSSWLITDSQWTLGNGWGGAVKSIDGF